MIIWRNILFRVVVDFKIKGFTYSTWGKTLYEIHHMRACTLSLPQHGAPRADSALRLKPDINSQSQIPGGRWAWRHKSKYFRSQSLLTYTLADHPSLNLPQHHKPAICHKVIIELSIGKQLTPFFAFFLLATPPSPPLSHIQPLIWTVRKKESELGVLFKLIGRWGKIAFCLFLNCVFCWSIYKWQPNSLFMLVWMEVVLNSCCERRLPPLRLKHTVLIAKKYNTTLFLSFECLNSVQNVWSYWRNL